MKIAIVTALLLASTLPAFAQTPAPFDMGPERAEEHPAAPPSSATQIPSSPPASGSSAAGPAVQSTQPPAGRPATPFQMAPQGPDGGDTNAKAGRITAPPNVAPTNAAPGNTGSGNAGQANTTPDNAAQRPPIATSPAQIPAGAQPSRAAGPAVGAPGLTPSEAQPVQAVSANTFDPNRRYLVPAPTLRMNGETEQRSWSIFLTAAQAASAAKLHIAYQNAVFVAPEASRLTMTINDMPVYVTKISSADQPTSQIVTIPAGVLKPGDNMIGFNMSARHRTDCTVESTYELWTDVDPKQTYLSFDAPQSGKFSRLDDIRAVGVDGQGKTRFRLIVPALDQLGATDMLLRLSQGLALMGGMPSQSFSFERKPEGPLRPGELAVFVGTPDELRPFLPQLTNAASNAAVVSYVDYPGVNDASALVLSGPSWPALQGLIDSFVASTDATGSAERRQVLSTSRWHGYDTPFLFSRSLIDLQPLGVTSEEFSGRLYRKSFTVGVPADFYANAYGEARIFLDAAYTADVLPGSHIDVFVNGNIASTVPIVSNGGAVLRHLPIKFTLRHFRPGTNTITIEAALTTASDKVCAPGETAGDKPRFVIFGSSQFQMPDFARIAQVPNLGALAGTGNPYGRSEDPVSLFLGTVDEKTLSAAATALGKISLASHRIVPVTVTTSAARMGSHNAMFVGTISQIPSDVLAQFKIDDHSRSSWGGEDIPATAPGSSLTLDQWQQRNDDNFLTRRLSSIATWAKQNFDLSANMLRFAPATDEMYSPPQNAKLIVAQDSNPAENGTWTALISPDENDLVDGMDDLSGGKRWSDLAGRISVYTDPGKPLDTVPVSWFHFMPSTGFSVSNARLIAANWLSDNIMSYGLLLGSSTLLLGLATSGLLSRLGRK